MQEVIKLNGMRYRREIQMLGDVEKITWFKCKLQLSLFSSDIEIYDQEFLDKLEVEYENICMLELTPPTFFI